MTIHDLEFSEDLLRGAEEIAKFLYGNREQRRKVYHLVASSNLPVFKLGSMICARKSVVLRWVQDQENRHAGEHGMHTKEQKKTRDPAEFFPEADE
jgi:hypothetical protein